MHEWRHCVAWLARVIKVESVLPAKIFKTPADSGPNENEKCSALVEDFDYEKHAADYQSEWKAFNAAKHARSLPG